MRMQDSVQRIKRAVDYVLLRFVHFLLKPMGQMIYGDRNIWIFSERGTDARDNGYHMYRYLRQTHPEQQAYYIIDKKSSDYHKVADLGNVVERNSLQHWLLYFGADVGISTHSRGLIPGYNWRYSAYATRQKNKGKVVFLQHGVTKDDMKDLYKENTDINLFICGAKPEYDYILQNYGYSREEVKYTGFARFDSLHDFATKRQVLIMPTWRNWLSPNFHGKNLTGQDVKNSLYVQKWSGFLKCDRLRVLAQKYGIQFVFYPHYEMQPFLHLFGQEQEHLVFADFAHFDVQQLLKESMLLVTDYSSVFFDFAYMQKPVVYYQFDEVQYRANHYARGYFDYRRNGFGINLERIHL